MPHPRPPAPNYTNAALVMLGVNLFWIFCVIWSFLGFAAVLLTAFGANMAIDRVAARGAGGPD